MEEIVDRQKLAVIVEKSKICKRKEVIKVCVSFYLFFLC